MSKKQRRGNSRPGFCAKFDCVASGLDQVNWARPNVTTVWGAVPSKEMSLQKGKGVRSWKNGDLRTQHELLKSIEFSENSKTSTLYDHQAYIQATSRWYRSHSWTVFEAKRDKEWDTSLPSQSQSANLEFAKGRPEVKFSSVRNSQSKCTVGCALEAALPTLKLKKNFTQLNYRPQSFLNASAAATITQDCTHSTEVRAHVCGPGFP